MTCRIIGTVTTVTKQQKAAASRPSIKLSACPALASQLHPSRNVDMAAALRKTTGSHAKLWWTCGKGPDHHWQAYVYRRTAGDGCPCCAGKKASVTNSLESLFPELSSEYACDLNGNTAADVVAGREKHVWWRCAAASHTWKATPAARTRIGTGCPYCSGYLATPENNLTVTYPHIAAQVDPTHPGNSKIVVSNLTPASATKVHWACDLGVDHRWPAKVATRTRATAKAGCPYCAGKKASVTNSLASLFPHIADEFDTAANNGLTADQVVAKSDKSYSWRCRIDPKHTWKTTACARTHAGNGCPDCRLQHHSEIEVRLAHELAQFLPVTLGEHQVRGARQRWDVDIVIPGEKLLVEYDGEYWHRGKDRKDRAKSNDLENAGWTVIRVRASLAPTGPNDVHVTSQTRAHEVAAAVLRKVVSLRPEALAADDVLEYEATGAPVVELAADAYLAELRRNQSTCVPA